MRELYKKFLKMPLTVRLAALILIGLYVTCLYIVPGFIIAMTAIVLTVLSIMRVAVYLIHDV